MYSLLNYIAATSKEIYESSTNSQMMANPLYAGSDHATLQSVETGLRGLSEDEKRLVGISTISVVARLSLEFEVEDVRDNDNRRNHMLILTPGLTSHHLNAFTAIALSRTNRRSGYCVQPRRFGVVCSGKCVRRYHSSIFCYQSVGKP